MLLYLLSPSQYAQKISPIIDKHKFKNPYKSTFLFILDEDFPTDLYHNKELNMLIIKPNNINENFISNKILNKMVNFFNYQKNKEVSFFIGKLNKDGKIETIAVFFNKNFNNDDTKLFETYPKINYNKALLNKLNQSLKKGFSKGR